MKNKRRFTPIQIIPVFFVVSLFLSCGSLPWINNSRSWHVPPEQEIAGTVWISGVEVDRTGVRNSIENEVSGLLPLFFWDRSYLVLEEMENADFIAEVKIREREYIKGWKTVCSTGVEIYFRPGKTHEGLQDGVSVPLAAAHTVRESKDGLSSSRNLRRLLESAVKEAIAALEKNHNA